MRNVFNFRWDCTCGACPEQYDIYLNGEKVAYFRLRWGYISVLMYDKGELVENYDESINGDIYGIAYGGPFCGHLDPNDEDKIKSTVEQKILEYLVEQRRKELKDEGK